MGAGADLSCRILMVTTVHFTLTDTSLTADTTEGTPGQCVYHRYWNIDFSWSKPFLVSPFSQDILEPHQCDSNVTPMCSRQTRTYRTILFRRNNGLVDGTVIELRAKSTLRDNILLGKQPGR